jgi:hypothetical protein
VIYNKHRSIAKLLLGVDGLAQYTLALSGEQTLATNLTGWFAMIIDFVLLIFAGMWLGR